MKTLEKTNLELYQKHEILEQLFVLLYIQKQFDMFGN